VEVEVAAAVSAAVLAVLAAAVAAAAGPVEITNKLIGCVKWQKYRINQKMFLFL
jgi:hypothetical protein